MSIAKRHQNALIALYILMVLMFSAVSKAEYKTLPYFGKLGQIKTHNYVGQLIQSVDNRYYLVMNQAQVFELSTEKDLSSFNGQVVQVQGFEVKDQVGPVFETQFMDPLQTDEFEGVTAPVLIVLEVSGLS